MEPDLKAASVPLSGLIYLQSALNDLQKMAIALHKESHDPNVSIVELLADFPDGDSQRIELMEALLELYFNTAGSDPNLSLGSLVEDRAGFKSRQQKPDSSTLQDNFRGRYQIVRHHAEGGLGTVSVAIDRELNREVALKQIHAQQADDPARRDRFVVEAEITGGLEHPGVVPVYSLGHSADGRPFYAMRLIRGETLTDAISRFHDASRKSSAGERGLELRKLLRQFLNVCNAIEYAHGRGILHRDLKPSNIMLGKHGETLVVDWGLAKPIAAIASEVDEEGPLLPSVGGGESLPGSAIGTPSFMSPEQASGRKAAIGPRSDIYSLGATLYCLLTGQAPFTSKEPGQILKDVQSGKFPKPRQLNAKVPRPLEAICLKALALASSDRYGSARELAEEIERWMADEPIAAQGDSMAQRFSRWTRHRRTMVTAVLASLIVATGALGIVLAVQSRANRDLRQANNASNRINLDLLEAHCRIEETNKNLQDASHRERARFELALDAIRTFHNNVSDDLLLREVEFAGLRSWLFRGALEFYRRLERELEDQPDRSSREAIARVHSQIADLEGTYGTPRETLLAYRKTLELRRNLASETPGDLTARSEVASSLISLGIMVKKYEGIVAGLHHLREARTILEELIALEPANRRFQGLLAQTEQEIGAGLVTLNRFPEALAAFDRGLKILRELARLDPSHQAALATLSNHKGVLLIFMHQHNEALETLRSSQVILERLVQADPSHPRFQLELSNVLKDIGDLVARTGDGEEALKLHLRALTIRESLSAALPASASHRISISHSLMAIGKINAPLGRKPEAIAAYRRSVALRESQRETPNSLFNLASTHANLAECLDGVDRESEANLAAQTFRRAIEVGSRESAAIRSNLRGRPHLRNHREIQLLLMDLEFPENPFSGTPSAPVLTHRD